MYSGNSPIDLTRESRDLTYPNQRGVVSLKIYLKKVEQTLHSGTVWVLRVLSVDLMYYLKDT